MQTLQLETDLYGTGFFGDKRTYYANKGRKTVTHDYVQQGMILQLTVMGEAFYVLKVYPDRFMVVGLYTGEVLIQQSTGGYYTLIKGKITPEIMMNIQSGKSHYMVGGKSLCGTVGDFTQKITSSETVTCKHCISNV